MARFDSLRTVAMFLCIKHPVNLDQMKLIIILLKEYSTLKYFVSVIYVINH